MLVSRPTLAVLAEWACDHLFGALAGVFHQQARDPILINSVALVGVVTKKYEYSSNGFL
jgi:hypothetical protein